VPARAAPDLIRFVLLGHEAAVDGHGYSSDERGGVGAESDDGLGNLRRRAHPADRIERDELCLGLGVTADDAIDHRRTDDTWADGVDAYPLLGVLERRGARQARDAVLTGDVGRQVDEADEPRDRRRS